MSETPNQPASGQESRRTFLKTSTAAVVGGSVLGSLGLARQAHAAGDDTIKIALIGCGGRGSGAAADAIRAAKAINTKVKLVAMADAFQDRLNGSYGNLKDPKNEVADSIDVSDDRKFVGFDAYQKAIDSGVDMVILATPPGFRPAHFEAAVKAGKHVFMEKPVATDAPGVRQVLAATEEAKKKGLGVGVGLQRRHQLGYIDTIKKLQDGAIGDIIMMRAYWNGSTPWVRDRKPEQTEMEYQMRNWYYFTWICGDHIVEQHIHNLDVINWVKGSYPVKAQGQGGREVRVGPNYGETFDHHFVEFEYADGSRCLSQCRHIPGCWNAVEEYVHGSKGNAAIHDYTINVNGEKRARYRGENPNPYQREHEDLLKSILAGSPINEGEYGAKSTMTAILGRMATYSGQMLEWDKALNSSISLQPTKFAWDAQMPVNPRPDGMYAAAVPGVTKVV